MSDTCFLFNGCPGRTAVCWSRQPDGDECPIYRWFKKQIINDICGKWISVNDRLPQRPQPCFHREWYLVAFDTGAVSMIFFDFDGEKWNSGGLHVTHWMPLPEPPKEDKP